MDAVIVPGGRLEKWYRNVFPQAQRTTGWVGKRILGENDSSKDMLEKL